MFANTGNQNYVAPEMLMGWVYDEKVDLWQAGCVMYALLTGHEPFP